MPTMDTLERDWQKAVRIVRENYPNVEAGSPQFWALVFGVVKRMRGRKSARHLKSILLEKVNAYDPITFLPFIFGMKVRGTDLWMDLPQHLAKEPPSAYPYLPLERSRIVDEVRKRIKTDLKKFVEEAVERFITYPIGFSADDIRPLISGSLTLHEAPAIPEIEEVGWKLLWVYGMVNGHIQPVTPRWGYRLALMSGKMRDLVNRRVEEHLRAHPISDPLSFVPDIAMHKPMLRPFVVISPSELNSVIAILPYRWETGSAHSMWNSLKSLLSNTVPAYFAYAIDLVGICRLEDMKFILPMAVNRYKVLCAFSNELAGTPAEFPIFGMPESEAEFRLKIRIAIRKKPDTIKAFKDEIYATLTPRWI